MSIETDKFVYQTRLFVTMRRVLTRVIDLEYFRINKNYAETILRLAEDSGDFDLVDVSAKLRQKMGLVRVQSGQSSKVSASKVPVMESEKMPDLAYIGKLR